MERWRQAIADFNERMETKTRKRANRESRDRRRLERRGTGFAKLGSAGEDGWRAPRRCTSALSRAGRDWAKSIGEEVISFVAMSLDPRAVSKSRAFR